VFDLAIAACLVLIFLAQLVQQLQDAGAVGLLRAMGVVHGWSDSGWSTPGQGSFREETVTFAKKIGRQLVKVMRGDLVVLELRLTTGFWGGEWVI
jgi:hypothetical protein